MFKLFFSAALLWIVLSSTPVNANLSSSLSSVSSSLRLRARQDEPLSLNDLPTQCRSDCTAAVTTANDPNCQLASCQCTNKSFTDLAGCFACVVANAGNTAAALQTAQTALDGFRSGCASSGFPIGGSSSATGAPSRSVSAAPGRVTTPLFSPTSTDLDDSFSTRGGVDDDVTTSTPTRPQSTITAPVGGNNPFGDAPNSPGNGALRFRMHPLMLILSVLGIVMLS